MSDHVPFNLWMIETSLTTSLSYKLLYHSLILVVTSGLVKVEAFHSPGHKGGDPPLEKPDLEHEGLRLTAVQLAILCIGIIALTIIIVAVSLFCWRCFKRLQNANTRFGFRYCSHCEQVNSISHSAALSMCHCRQRKNYSTNCRCNHYTCKRVHHSEFFDSDTNYLERSVNESRNENPDSVGGRRPFCIPHVDAHDLSSYFHNTRKKTLKEPHNNRKNSNDPQLLNIPTEQLENNLSVSRTISDSHNSLAQPPSSTWLKNIDPTLKDLCQITNRSVTKQVGKKLVVFLTQEVDFRGQTLVLDNMGISLSVPYGAIPHGMKNYVSLVLNWDLTDNPDMSADQSLVSPVVYCGPHGSKFKRKCELSFKHCAFDQKQIQVLTSETDLTQTKNWTSCTSSTKTKSITFTQDSCNIQLSHFSLYTCILYPNRMNPGKKWIQIAIFSNPLHYQINHYQFRVYFLNKTPCALQWAIQNEEKFGATLCCPEKVFLFDGSHGDMCMAANYLSDQWEQLDDSNIEKVPFIQIWHGVCPHVSLCFKREDDTLSKELNLQLVFYQQGQTKEREKMTVHMTEQQQQGPLLDDVICKKHEFHFHFQGANQDHIDDIEIATSFHCIPYELKQKLCLLLNPQEPFGNDWRMFASKLGFDSCIKYIQSQANPMGVLLDRVECEGTRLDIIEQMLRDIERPDAAEEVSKFMESTSRTGMKAIENEY